MENNTNVFVDIILPIILLIAVIVAAIILYKKLQKKFNTPVDHTFHHTSKPQVKLKETYCTEKEMIFLNALHKALPRDCISFPNVGVSKLIEPKGNLVDYKSVMDKYVDICVFLRKGMKPILVIDLFEQSPAAQQLKKFDEDVSAILKTVKISVLHKQIESSYSIEDLRIEVLKSMNSDDVAYLKDRTIYDTKK